MLGRGQKIPTAFIKGHFRELQQEVTLQNGDGKAWKVSFRNAEKYPHWKVGWRAFSKGNNLHAGDIIVFALVANSQFLFTVFDKHGIMKKNIAPVIKNHHTPNSSKTHSTGEEEDSDDHRSLPALAIKRKYSRRTSAAPVEVKVEENAESDVRVVESSDIEEAEAEEEEDVAELKILNPPVEKEHDERGVYNRSSELGKDRHDIVMNAAQRSLGRNGGDYGDMGYPPHRDGQKEVAMERSRPMTRSAAVGQQSLASQPASQKVKRTSVELECSEGRKHTAEPEEDDQSNRDQSNFVQAKDHGSMQVPKLKLNRMQEISPLSHYFRSKRRTPTRLERQGAVQAAETYARSLRALNFVMTMAEFEVYIDFQLVSRQSLCLSATSFWKAPFR